MTLTIELPDVLAGQLINTARTQGQTAEECAATLLSELLRAERQKRVDAALAHILETDHELLKRLA